jgi:hypothetical protein
LFGLYRLITGRRFYQPRRFVPSGTGRGGSRFIPGKFPGHGFDHSGERDIQSRSLIAGFGLA